MLDISPENSKTILYTIMAAIGGALGWVFRAHNAGRSIKVFEVLLSSAVAAFVGYHALPLYYAIGLPEGVVGSLNGLTAFFGIKFTLSLVDKMILSRFGLSDEQRTKQAFLMAGWSPPGVTTRMDDLQPLRIFEDGEQGTKIISDGSNSESRNDKQSDRGD